MFGGMLIGILWHTRSDIIRRSVKCTPVVILIWTTVILCFFTNLFENLDLVEIFIFCLLILMVASDKAGLNLENKYLVYPGMISYGIYVFHPMASYPVRYLVSMDGTLAELLLNYPIFYFIAVFVIAILMAHISFRYYESVFLRMKKY